jgi:hypothetical protein
MGGTSKRFAAAAASITVAFAIAAPSAAAKTVTFGGDAEIGGQIAMDVTVKKGKAKRIIGLRALDLPATCEISGEGSALNLDVGADIKVNKKGKFSIAFADDYGNQNALSGKFKGKKAKTVTGLFTLAGHYPAEGDLPEEDCTTGETAYSAAKGGPDVVIPETHLRR